MHVKFRIVFGSVLYGWSYDDYAESNGLSRTGGFLDEVKRQRLEKEVSRECEVTDGVFEEVCMKVILGFYKITKFICQPGGNC